MAISKERITLDMSVKDMVFAMSGGNPGAMTACLELLSKGEKIDPDAFGGG